MEEKVNSTEKIKPSVTWSGVKQGLFNAAERILAAGLPESERSINL